LEKLAKIKNLVKRDSDEIMATAFNSIENNKSYDTIYYNCEFFVTQCVYGSGISSQTEVKYMTISEEFCTKFLKLFIIYLSLYFIWKLEFIRNLVEKILLSIRSESQWISINNNLKTFVDSLPNDFSDLYTKGISKSFAVVCVISLIVFIPGVLLLQYFYD
jgi:hypothetical protein